MHPPLEVHQHPDCKEVWGRVAHCLFLCRALVSNPCCSLSIVASQGVCICLQCVPLHSLDRQRRRRRRLTATASPAVPLPPALQCIEALKRCHADHPVSKYWGECNRAAYELNICFAGEKVVKR